MNAPLHREMPAGHLDSAQALAEVTQRWQSSILPELKKYIEIPAKSPSFDADWATHGHIETVLRNAAAWVEAQKVEGLRLEVVPCDLKTANEFVRRLHRHSRPVVGHKFAVAVAARMPIGDTRPGGETTEEPKA